MRTGDVAALADASTSAQRLRSRSPTLPQLMRRLNDGGAYGRMWSDALLRSGLLEGKVVLDVGADLGLRALLALRAGAAHVYAVPEHSHEVVRRVVTANGAGDRISVLECSVDAVVLPAGARCVDVVLSDWIGRAGLYASLAPAVIRARDRHLAADGVVLPDRAQLCVEGVCAPRLCAVQRRGWWRSVYGWDLSAVVATAALQPSELDAEGAEALTDQGAATPFDVQENPASALAVDEEFRLAVHRGGTLHGFRLTVLAGFRFGASGEQLVPWPLHPATFFPVARPIQVAPGDVVVTALRGRLRAADRSISSRHCAFDIEWAHPRVEPAHAP